MYIFQRFTLYKSQQSKSQQSKSQNTRALIISLITLFYSNSSFAMHGSGGVYNQDLSRAVTMGDLSTVQAIINAIPEYAKRQHFEQVLMAAVYHNNHDIAELALQNGANPNTCLNTLGFTVLMRAALRGDLRMIKLLLEYRADVLLLDGSGHDALNYCSSNSTEHAPAIAQFLTEHMQQAGYPTQTSLNSALHETITKNRRRDVCPLIVKLIDLGANPQIVNKNNNSLIDISLQQLSSLDRGASNIPIKDKIGALYIRGALPNNCDMRSYLEEREITCLEEEKAKFETEKAERLIKFADEQYMATKHAQKPNLLKLSFFEHHSYTTQEELDEHAPFPTALTHLAAEYVTPTPIPNPRKRKRADSVN